MKKATWMKAAEQEAGICNPLDHLDQGSNRKRTANGRRCDASETGCE